jgi:hypothetical protein
MGISIYVRRIEIFGRSLWPHSASGSPNQGFLNGLTWQGETGDTEESVRIPMFPSWSWAGWAVSAIELSSAIDTGSSEEPHISIETAEGLLLPIPDDKSQLRTFKQQIPRHVQFIHVEARMFTCSFLACSPPGTSGQSWPCIKISNNPLLCLRPQEFKERSQAMQGWPNSLMGILVGDTSGNTLNVAALICKELDGYYERITCSNFNFDLYVHRETGLRPYPYGMLDRATSQTLKIFKEWIRDETARKTIRLG